MRALLPAALLFLPAASPVETLDLEITGLRNAKGVLQICLTARPDSFPDCKDDPRAISRTISAAHPAVRFEGLATATYAVAVIHDANSNKKLDTMMGIPKEGFGFSRNPVITFGPPKFKAACFPLDGAKQQVKMRYML
jgi:uncharacterized protein (DUF2141 family)